MNLYNPEAIPYSSVFDGYFNLEGIDSQTAINMFGEEFFADKAEISISQVFDPEIKSFLCNTDELLLNDLDDEGEPKQIVFKICFFM